jgi:uncharacterized membrane protein YfcA
VDGTAVQGVAAVLVVMAAGLLKGAIGFGFPALATPVLALLVDVPTAVAVLILPNMLMDGAQALRRGGLRPVARRQAVLLVFGAGGMVVGTWLLVGLPPRVALYVLGVFVLLFVVLNVRRVAVHITPVRERWLAPVVGLVAGVVGGITNVPGTPLVIWFYALGLDKHEFVRSVSFTFVVLKLVQLAAATHYGLMTWNRTGVSVVLTAVAFAGFAAGLRVQDRLEQAPFNRAVLGALAVLGLGLIARAAFSGP